MEDDSETETETYHEIYGVQLLDDIHNYLPALLYDTDRFNTIGDILRYVGARAYHYNDTVYTQHVEEARRRRREEQRSELRRNGGRALAYPSQDSLFSSAVSAGSGGIMNSFLSRPPLYHTPVGTHFSIVDTLMQFSRGNPRSRHSTTTTTADAHNTIFPLNFFDPVPIVPSQAQIEAACTVGTIGTDIGLGANPDDNLCSICQDNYTTGDVVRRVNHCGHMYHRTCIDRWFLSNVHCPLCRHDIRASVAPSETPSVAPSETPSVTGAQNGEEAETNHSQEHLPPIRTPPLRRREWGELLDSPINLDSPDDFLNETHEMNITANLLESTIGLLDVSGGFGFDISGSQTQVRQQQTPVFYASASFLIDEFMYESDMDVDNDSYSEERDSLS